MTRPSWLLKQLFVVTLAFACSLGQAVELEDFWSTNPAVQAEAIKNIRWLSPAQHDQLNTHIVRESFTGRTEVIIALLNTRTPGRKSLIQKLLSEGAPSPVIPALIEAIRTTFNVAQAELIRLHRIVVGPSPEKAATAAYSISLIVRAKELRDEIDVLYGRFANSEIPHDNLRAILSQMHHWEVVPRLAVLEPFLNHLCRDGATTDVRFEAAVLTLKLYAPHEISEAILRPIAASAESSSWEVQSITKALLSTPHLAANDIELIYLLLENPKTPDFLKGALSWRMLRAKRLSGDIRHLNPRWQGMLKLLDDPELDEEAAQVLLQDLAAYITENRTLLTPLGEIGENTKINTSRGKLLLARLEVMSQTNGCPNNIAVPLSSAIPDRFLQAILF